MPLICQVVFYIIIFGGYEAYEALISTKPATSSTILVIDLLRKVAISKVASAEHATAGHSLARLSDSVLLIGGGTQKEILLFTKFMPSADLCDLADNCIINNTSVTSPIPWLKCDGVCKRWIYQVCTGLCVIPKEKYICRDCKKTSNTHQIILLLYRDPLLVIYIRKFAGAFTMIEFYREFYSLCASIV